jgi:hypothetical protein
MWLRNLIVAIAVVATLPAIADEQLSAKRALAALTGKKWAFNCYRENVAGRGEANLFVKDGAYFATVRATDMTGLPAVHQVNTSVNIEIAPTTLEEPLRSRAVCGRILGLSGCFVINSNNYAKMKLYYFSGYNFFGLLRPGKPNVDDYCIFTRL